MDWPYASPCSGSIGRISIFEDSLGQSRAGSFSEGSASVCNPCRESTVARIVSADGDLDQAVANQSITLTLADEIDVSLGT